MNIKVNGCWDCPFKKKVYGVVPGVGDMSGSESTMRYVCSLKDDEETYCLGDEFESDWMVGDFTPEWCPLKKDPLTIELEQNTEVGYVWHQIQKGFTDRVVFDLCISFNGRQDWFRKDEKNGGEWRYHVSEPVPSYLITHLERIYNELQPK